MVEPLIKSVPVTVSVKAALPEVMLAGDKAEMVGVALVATALIVNTPIFELPPPGVPEKTVIFAVPAVATMAEPTEAVNCVALTNVVVSAIPFQLTIDPLMKLEPFIVSIKAGEPAFILVGDIEAITGTGLTVPPPPGLTSVVFLQEKMEINKRAMV